MTIRDTIRAAALVWAVLSFGASTSWAVDQCKAKIDRKTGAIEISARGVGSEPRWGTSPDRASAVFFNGPDCAADGKLKNCSIGAPGTSESRARPADCVLWVADEGPQPPCLALIKGCVQRPQDGGPDGVVYIDQARAIAGGVNPGDEPGFPVVISVPGSYRLTSNLNVREEPGAENVTAIEIVTPFVTIDLNGFAILGPTVCERTTPVTCAPTGSGDGIAARGPQTEIIGILVKNGVVAGMGDYGIELREASQVADVRAIWNGNRGIEVLSGAVTGSIARSNGFEGISTSAGLMRGNVANFNGSTGISTGPASLVAHNIVVDNGARGISTSSAALVADNVASGNASEGVSTLSPAGFRGNVLTFNNGGTGQPQTFMGTEIGDNLCDTNTTCP